MCCDQADASERRHLLAPSAFAEPGYTMQRPTEDRFLLSTSELKNRFAVLMGSRASERLIFDGDVSTGAADDLQRATEIAVEMVTIRHGPRRRAADLRTRRPFYLLCRT